MTWPATRNPFGREAATRIQFPEIGPNLMRRSLQSLPTQCRREVPPDTTSVVKWVKENPIVAGLLGVVAWKVPVLVVGLGAAVCVVDWLFRGDRSGGILQAPNWASKAVHSVSRHSGAVAGSLAAASFVTPWVSAIGLAALAAFHRLAALLPNPGVGQ